LITGCNGFVGRHLALHLHSAGVAVAGVDIQDACWADWMDYKKIDISDTDAIVGLVLKNQVRQIYHLAAIANPRYCNQDPVLAARVNILGTLGLLESCRADPSIRLLVIGSSEEYRRKDGARIVYSEDDDLDPRGIYGATKISAELLGKSYHALYQAQVFFTRSFNHTGPGQPPDYVLSDFAKQCAEIFLGMRSPVISVGNIDILRDFLDVRDVVRAYASILENGRPGETYNVCSGSAVSLRGILEKLIAVSGRDDIEISIEPGRLRNGEQPFIIGDNRKIAEDTGWRPCIDIRDTVKSNFEYWLEKLKQ
jgi:GDP-4-dehydro-6-deoxy-D-mannose reductase